MHFGGQIVGQNIILLTVHFVHASCNHNVCMRFVHNTVLSTGIQSPSMHGDTKVTWWMEADLSIDISLCK